MTTFRQADADNYQERYTACSRPLLVFIWYVSECKTLKDKISDKFVKPTWRHMQGMYLALPGEMLVQVVLSDFW